ncbi:histone deacetylase [Streptomyces sp. NBC_00094]|uniref:histone deacetylase n=1 Tax=Streptomyces sp. NBC_00094 TaxID=2903620 RepID=UPI00224DD3EB|nr:histone deacetylase [Streptomyces sp. NBC_00094]MCX5390312.1 histone deacetylase [Streptomyces sp. NBC_00094]
MSGESPRVWYAAYGTNTRAERLGYYLAGGRPPGAAREFPGCRDPRAPERSVALVLPGRVYFATESPVWGGGRAFYDPAADGTAWGVAHLLTVGQFSDIAAQEMYREPGDDLDPAEALATGRCSFGPGRYETLVCPGVLDDGDIDGLPVLTFTAPWPMPEEGGAGGLRPPSAAYLRQVAAGLYGAGAWRPAEVAAYLAGCPGAAGHWTPEAVAALSVPTAPTGPPGPPSRCRPDPRRS